MKFPTSNYLLLDFKISCLVIAEKILGLCKLVCVRKKNFLKSIFARTKNNHVIGWFWLLNPTNHKLRTRKQMC